MPPDDQNPFDVGDLDAPQAGRPIATPPAQPSTNPFDAGVGDLDNPQGRTSSATGAFVRGAERAALPAVGGLAAAGAGARLGSLAGAAIGSAFPGAGTAVGGVAGGIIGGLGGFFAGSYATAEAQSYAVSKAPDSWVETFGQDDQQQKLDQEQHPYATFMGGMTPFALTMTPFGAATGLPANATTLQRILSNPATARVFGGAANGGFELGHELLTDQAPDWTKVAVATGFGVVFNRFNVIGQKIEGFGARLAGDRPVGAQGPEGVAPDEGPTTIQGSALDVMGEGVTEPVFMGSLERDPVAKKNALMAEIVEQETLGDGPIRPEMQVDAAARRAEPDLLSRYDELHEQVQSFRERINELTEAPRADVEASLVERQQSAQAAYDAHLAEAGGYTGSATARRLRAQIREIERDLVEVRGEEGATVRLRDPNDPEVAAVRQQLLAADTELRDLSREVAATRRRAAESLDSEMIEPVGRQDAVLPEGAAPAPEPVTSLPPLPVAPLEAQRAAIVADVQNRLVAAGRPVEEAAANAAVIAARFETRAARFKGELGSAEELYRREGADIRGPGGERTAAGRPEASLELEQTRRGNIKFYEDSTRPIVTMAKDADASTFMHESGHQFLEEMLRDAGHASAPESIKLDTQAIRKYLKMGEDAYVPNRRQHERFARSFEQYLREGVAPSRELAQVFSQFREWLVRIYESLRSLGRPISDDIREVFDRMLAETPNRTVISPEGREPGSLGAAHTREAIEVEPQDAAGVAARLANERNAFVDRLPEQVRNELEAKVVEIDRAAAERAGETGAGPAGSEPVAGSAAGSDAVGGGAGGGAEPAPVRGGGGSAAPKGSGLSGGTGTADLGKPLAERPFDDLSVQPSKFVDLAGNIRIENLTNSEDLAAAIRESAARNNDFSDVRGPMTRSQISDAASELGLRPGDIDLRGLSDMFGGVNDLAPKILALRRLTRDSAAQVVSDMNLVAGSPTDPALVAQLARTISRHDMIQSTLAGATAQWGRAGQAFRSIVPEWNKALDVNEFLQQNTGRSFDQMVDMAKRGKSLDSPAKVSKFVRDASKRSFGRMGIEYFINALVSAPAGRVTDLIGNTVLLTVKIVPETIVGAALGKARQLAGQERSRIRIGEVGAQISELGRAFPKAVEAGAEAARSGIATRIPGDKSHQPYFDQSPELQKAFEGAREISNADMSMREAATSIFGMIRGGRDSIMAQYEIMKSGVQPGVGVLYRATGQIPDITVRGAPVLPIGTVARIPSRAIATLDSFSRTLAYATENSAKAYRQAVEEGLSGGALYKRIAELRQNPSEESMADSASQAAQLSLMSHNHKFTRKIAEMANYSFRIPGLGETPLLKIVLPFVNIAANLVDQALVKRTPLGYLSPELHADLTGRNGPIAQDTAQARMLFGSVMGLTFSGLAAQELITGGAPKDKDEAAVWREAGYTPYSVRIGDIWYDTRRIGPFGMLLGVSADMNKVVGSAQEGEMAEAAGTLVQSFAHNILDQSFMRGPAELIQAIEDGDRYGQRYVQNFLSSFVPFSVGLGSIARSVDPYTRQARTTMDAIIAKMPVDIGFGKSTDLLPRRSIWGQPIPNYETLGGALTSIYASKVNNDPVTVAMVELGMGVAAVKRTVMNVELTDQQFDDYARFAGVSAKQRLDVMVNAPQFKSWPPAIRRQVITETINRSREAARGLLMMKYPQIPRDAAQSKLDDLRSPD